MRINFFKIFAAYPLIYFSMLIGITPGNIGITEWTWTGALMSFGENANVAGEYAVFNKMVTIGAQITAFFLMASTLFAIKKTKALRAY